MDQKQREIRNRVGRLSQALVGQPEEITLAEAQELVSLTSTDVASLCGALYAKLYAEAQQYWMAGNTLPPLLKSALEGLRPSTAPPRNEKELGKQAKARVESLVEEAKILPALLQRGEPQFRVSAFRKKGQLTKKDRMLLDKIAEDMKKKLRGEDT